MKHKLLAAGVCLAISIVFSYAVYLSVIAKKYVYVPFYSIGALFCLGFCLMWLFVARTGE